METSNFNPEAQYREELQKKTDAEINQLFQEMVVCGRPSYVHANVSRDQMESWIAQTEFEHHSRRKSSR